MPMSPAAKAALAATIRALRARLLDDLRAEAEGRYRLRLPAEEAGLPAREAARRARIEEWIREQQRAELASGRKGGARPTAAFWRELEEQAASTLLNRLVVLRLMEAPVDDETPPLRQPPVLTGGWQSRGYADLRALAPALARGDETEGYAFLLQLIFDELAADLPGIFGPVGLTALMPLPAATLRHLVSQLDQPALAPCWADEMTLGWVYQYWNDPAREALDAKINAGGKIEPHEIASKTQMFTERYMVDWLLQNSLGPLWLAICENNGWVPRVVADGTLDRLEARRAAWRAQRAAGTVAPTDLMPLHSPDERRWAYLVPAPAGARPPASALRSIRDLRLIDPAVGSGHFLVVALDLLLALHEEEAAHRGQPFSAVAAAEHIIESSLHGVDLDPRAVQIAAAAVYLCAQQRARGARPAQMNLVASTLRLARLPPKDPAIAALRQAVQTETGVPATLIDQLVAELAGADHLGSLLRVDEALDAAIAAHEATLGKVKPEQIKLFDRPAAVTPRARISAETAKATVVGQLEAFLADHTSADDLGLRLAGEQLAAGVRFVRLIKPGAYDVVVANPPYLGAPKLAHAATFQQGNPIGKADYFAAFMLRGLQLTRPGGVSAMLTLSNWMFLKAYSELRESLLTAHLELIADFGKAAFSEGGTLISTCASVFRNRAPSETAAVGLRTFEDYEARRDEDQPLRVASALVSQAGTHHFHPAALKVVPEWPLVYWWDAEMLRVYQSAPLIGRCAPVVKGLTTCDDTRFVRCFWEPAIADVATGVALTSKIASRSTWSPFVNGAKGEAWLDSPRLLVKWRLDGIQIAHAPTNRYGRGQKYYFRRGIAFTQIGSDFTVRAHHFPSVLGNKGSSVFPTDLAGAVCAMNSTRAKEILSSLNPGIGFEVGDVNRLPLFPIDGADAIFAQVEAAFGVHEAHREPSVEFRRPGPSPWRAAQAWAQTAVDRPAGAPLPPYTEALDPEPPTDHLSFALGVALGRFGAPGSGQEGPLDPATADLRAALPHGLLFLDQTYGEGDHRDGLGHPAAAPLHAAWATHAPAIGAKKGLRAWLADEFFAVHRAMYDNRPIHWPLSSAQRTFVAWVNIHRMGPQTLRVLLADHLAPARARLDGALADLRAARDGADKKASKQAEKALEKLIKQRDELAAFTAAVEACADAGPPPPDAKCPPREVDARYAPDLDDGVMINSAALWPLLDAQWKDPKKWWVELATAKDRKDYDWAQLARRYWPSRVAAKCAADPSLAVAHGSFWRLHPARAWAWELRLQDELGLGGPSPESDVPHATPGPRAEGWAGRITEADTQGDEAPHRAAYLRDHGPQAIEAVEREATRRMGRGAARRVVPRLTLLEAGLWAAHPSLMWAAELRLISRQGADLRIEARDEPQARAALLAAEPHRNGERAAVLRAAQEQQAALFTAAEGEEEDSAGGDEEEEG